MQLAFVFLASLILQIVPVDPQKNQEVDFSEIAPGGKTRFGRIIVGRPPKAIANVIRDGTVSLASLRQMSKSTNVRERFWAIYCIGKMSCQQRDCDHLSQLAQSEEWHKGVSKYADHQIMDILRTARNSILNRLPKAPKKVDGESGIPKE